MTRDDEIKALLEEVAPDELSFAAAHVDACARKFINDAPTNINYLLDDNARLRSGLWDVLEILDGETEDGDRPKGLFHSSENDIVLRVIRRAIDSMNEMNALKRGDTSKECPTCGGCGLVQSWEVEDCEECGGSGRIDIAIRCDICGEFGHRLCEMPTEELNPLDAHFGDVLGQVEKLTIKGDEE